MNINIQSADIFIKESRCCECEHRRDEIRLIPMLGKTVEQSGPVAKTPQYQQKRPVQGVLLMTKTMTATQECDIELAAADRKGNPAVIESGEWTTDNSDMLSLEPDPANLLKCKVSAFGPIGSAKVFFTGDGKVGPETKIVIGEIGFNITAGDATVLDITAGEAREQPE